MEILAERENQDQDATAIAQERLRQAIAYHQSGNLSQAQELYLAVLRTHPGQYDATRLMGIIAYQQNENRRAIEWYVKAISFDPTDAAVYMDLGNVLKRQGEFRAALECYERAIALRPVYPEAFTNQGNTLIECGDFAAAVASYDTAIAASSGFAQAHYGRARALRELGRLEEAIAGYDRSIACKPDYVEAYYDRGNALLDLGRPGDALESYDRAIAIKPDHAESFNNRGNALLALDRRQEALASFEIAIAIRPANAQAHNNLGKVWSELGQSDTALACYETALGIDPGLTEAYNNLGNVLVEFGRYEEAFACFERGIAVSPEDADLHWNKSLLLLLTGDFENGWDLYERRWKTKGISSRRRNFAQPVWRGSESIHGRTILLHNEQGLGDLIQFGRYARLVAARGARVVLEVPRQLQELLRTMEGVSEVVVRGSQLPPFDCHCSVLSLPYAFRTTMDSIPSAPAYLSTANEKRTTWQKILGERKRKRIGLVWSGNPEHKNDRNRSLAVEAILPFLPDTYEYICLQSEIRSEDRKALHRDGRIRFFDDAISDFSDTAALCDLVDVVVSVDTSVAHLAGALGRPTLILLPFNPDWRWLLDRRDSPWYPSVRLLRQSVRGKWNDVLRELTSSTCF